MSLVRRNAFAKVNLFLDVASRREDGYHDVTTVLSSISLADDLCFEAIQADTVIVESDCAELGCGPKNLVYAVARFLKDNYGINSGVKVTLTKRVPIGGGLGGGSSDAAATFLACNELFSLGFSDEELLKLSAQFGADVPFFIKGGCAYAKGIGDNLSFFKNNCSFSLIVVNPGYAISTQKAYALLDKTFGGRFCPEESSRLDELIAGLKEGCYIEVARNLFNVFEKPIFEQYPDLRQLKESLIELGCDNALLSGSGSTVFGIIDCSKEEEKATIVEYLRKGYPFCQGVECLLDG